MFELNGNEISIAININIYIFKKKKKKSQTLAEHMVVAAKNLLRD